MNKKTNRKKSVNLPRLKFNSEGLIPAIIQDYNTDEVLMLAYMNRESLKKTLKSGKTCFWSRSRRKLWVKGETSGHFQFVKRIFYDCDKDTLLVKVEQVGVACHTGKKSCFYRRISF
jgi:phosphoribosyl-AMP cyclohydrolase